MDDALFEEALGMLLRVGRRRTAKQSDTVGTRRAWAVLRHGEEGFGCQQQGTRSSGVEAPRQLLHSIDSPVGDRGLDEEGCVCGSDPYAPSSWAVSRHARGVAAGTP